MHHPLDWNGPGGLRLLRAAGFADRLGPDGAPDGLEFRTEAEYGEIVIYVRDHRPSKHGPEGVLDERTLVYEALLPNRNRPDDVAGRTPLADFSAGLSFVTVDARNILALVQNEFAAREHPLADEGFVTGDDNMVITMPFWGEQFDYAVFPHDRHSAATEFWTLANPADVHGAPYIAWRDAVAAKTLEAAAEREAAPAPGL